MTDVTDGPAAPRADQARPGPQFRSPYAMVKEHEYDEFMRIISLWEREHLLLNVRARRPGPTTGSTSSQCGAPG